jgi:hypothetical protein
MTDVDISCMSTFAHSGAEFCRPVIHRIGPGTLTQTHSLSLQTASLLAGHSMRFLQLLFWWWHLTDAEPGGGVGTCVGGCGSSSKSTWPIRYINKTISENCVGKICIQQWRRSSSIQPCRYWQKNYAYKWEKTRDVYVLQVTTQGIWTIIRKHNCGQCFVGVYKLNTNAKRDENWLLLTTYTTIHMGIVGHGRYQGISWL